MVMNIKGVPVIGVISEKGKCPSCKKFLIVKDKDYIFIKNRGTVEFNNGEKYIKCSCGKFTMMKGIAN